MHLEVQNMHLRNENQVKKMYACILNKVAVKFDISNFNLKAVLNFYKHYAVKSYVKYTFQSIEYLN